MVKTTSVKGSSLSRATSHKVFISPRSAEKVCIRVDGRHFEVVDPPLF
jgi:hypothetical protein